MTTRRTDNPNWVHASAVTSVNCPLAQTFVFVCNPLNDPKWMPKVVKVEKVTAGPIGVGTIFRQTATVLGMMVQADWKITEYENNRVLHGRSIHGPLSFEGGYDFEEKNNVTLVRKYASFDLSGMPPFMPMSVVNRLLGSEFDGALQRLKRLLES